MEQSQVSLQVTGIISYEQEPSGALLSPDEKYLVTYRSTKINIWEMPAFGAKGIILKTPSGIIHDLTFSPDGTILAAATDEGQVVMWSFPQGERLRVLNGDLNKQGFFKNLFGYHHNQVAFSPDGKYLASLDNSARPLLWETQNFALFTHLYDPVFDSEYNTMAFSPDSKMLVVAHGHTAVLYDVHLGIKIEDFGAIAESLAFHHSKKQIAVGYRDKITLFDPKAADAEFRTKKEDRIISINNIVFSPDGNYLLAVGRSVSPSVRGRVLYGWSLLDGESVLHIPPETLANISGDNNISAGAGIHIISRNKALVVLKDPHRMVIIDLGLA
ncbi:MAG TPA: hypothetical protein VN426_01385 [Syntrophomonadaceae bacterium]|nr:hypothetical protein [Syntrophomonadaceae bacterium]